MSTLHTHQPHLIWQHNPEGQVCIELWKDGCAWHSGEGVSHHVLWEPPCVYGLGSGPLPPVCSLSDCPGVPPVSREQPSVDFPSEERPSPLSSSWWSLWRVQPPPLLAQVSRWALQEAHLQVQLHQLVLLHEVVETPSPEPGLGSLVLLAQIDEDPQAFLDACEGPP